MCGRPAAPRSRNRSFPFCSDRCRLVDLSKWLGGEYRISGPGIGDGEESIAVRPESEDEG
ncbi:MAG TPA: DNA gyrase inhibitor YacG [Anaeromyxobacter sp.]|nr:DNA gyrase inhibitor YacG [Anaeromyxobacter sp.]